MNFSSRNKLVKFKILIKSVEFSPIRGKQHNFKCKSPLHTFCHCLKKKENDITQTMKLLYTKLDKNGI